MDELSLGEIQKASLNILLEIDKICRKENLVYYLAYGTLIGAIRHGGFIPWDDDIDIMMPAADYKKLREYFLANDTWPLKICDRDNCKNYSYGIPRISDERYQYITTNGIEKSPDIGTFVDIYILDNYGDTKDESLRLCKKISSISAIYAIYVNPYNGKHNLKTVIRYAISFLFSMYKTVVRNFSIEKRITSIIDSVPNGRFIGVPRWDVVYGCIPFDREVFSERIECKFEDHLFYIPKEYDEILRRVYGEYMKLPPKEKRIPHHDYRIMNKNGT